MLRKILVSALAFLVTVVSSAQQVDSLLNVMLTQHPAEKVFIHYDREYYTAGETIWFKAYLYQDGKPDAASHNLYLQFTDAAAGIIGTYKYPVAGATASGSITIPDSLPPGNYYIRALTPDMLNYDESFIYKKNIIVLKPGTIIGAIKPTAVASLDFYPESGSLIEGLLTVVAFKATDEYGAAVELNGYIKTEEGVTVAPFATYHDGIGRVQFKPQAGKKYTAEVETAAGKRQFSLPPVQSSGLSLKVQDEKGGKKFVLARGEKGKEQFANLLLVVQMNSHVVYETEIAFEDYPSLIGHLITDSLPSGILHFTVFDDKGMPVAERLSFIDNNEYKAAGTLNVTKLATAKREENSFELSFADSIQRSLSVSVVEIGGSGKDNAENMYSSLLLTADLKNHVHDPAWYLGNKTDSTSIALDNLMLTQSWGRFSWKKLLAKELPQKKYTDRPFISIAGTVVDEKTKTPITTGALGIFIEAEDSTTQSLEAALTATGKFQLDSLAFRGKANFYYAYTDKQGKPRPALVQTDENEMEKQVIKAPVPLPAEAGMINIAGFSYNEQLAKRISDTKNLEEKIKELENVTVKSKTAKTPLEIVNEKYTSDGVFRTDGKVNIDNINNPVNDRSMNVVDFIKNRIQQVEIQNGRFVNRKNISLMTGQKWVVGLFLNEQQTDMGFLQTIRANDVALIKFFDAGFVGVGSGSPGGAIAVYTKERFVEEEKPDKLSFFTATGYTMPKQFYSPVYTTVESKQAGTDGRTTLYWSPDVYTDAATTSIKLNFFNNDFAKKFKVVVEGFDAAGKLVHIEKILGTN